MGVIHLDDAAMEFFRRRSPHDPAVIADERLRAYAERTGGVTLEYWRLAMGRIWGEPFMMTDDEVAKRLKRPISELKAIVAETNAACGWSTGGGHCSSSL